MVQRERDEAFGFEFGRIGCDQACVHDYVLAPMEIYLLYAFLDRAIASRASRSAVRRRSVSRLSHCCLPLAKAISHLILPFLKYMRVGTSVYPRCCVLPASLRSSSACTSNFRVRSGVWAA